MGYQFTWICLYIIHRMFGKVKQFVIEKAFSLAFMRYDRNNSSMLDKDQLTSLINDAFQLLRIPRQVSWMETAFLLKMFDEDGNDQISKEQCHEAFTTALAKFGGLSGIAKFAGFGKTSSAMKDEPDPYAHIPREEDEIVYEKSSGKLDLPEDIDESMLAKLPPVGQNLKPEDKQAHSEQKKEHPPIQKQEESAFLINQGGNQQGGQSWQQWGTQQSNTGNQQWGQQGNQWGSQQHQWGANQQGGQQQWGVQQQQWGNNQQQWGNNQQQWGNNQQQWGNNQQGTQQQQWGNVQQGTQQWGQPQQGQGQGRRNPSHRHPN